MFDQIGPDGIRQLSLSGDGIQPVKFDSQPHLRETRYDKVYEEERISQALRQEHTKKSNRQICLELWSSENWKVPNILISLEDYRKQYLSTLSGAKCLAVLMIIGLLTACTAYIIDISDIVLFDYKYGYCKDRLHLQKNKCCSGSEMCAAWISWSEFLQLKASSDSEVLNLSISTGIGVMMAIASCFLALRQREEISIASTSTSTVFNGISQRTRNNVRKIFYPIAGSGVAEVKLISAGIYFPGCFSLRTLLLKLVAIVLSVSSGLSLGKEGPYVHIGSCISSAVTDVFRVTKPHEQRSIMEIGAAVGFAVAFGAPIAGAVFQLEELSQDIAPRQVLQTLFCCIVATVSLKLLNPYETNQAVMFHVHYLNPWQAVELPIFILLGILGGALGAIFVKASSLRIRLAHHIPFLESHPLLEVALVTFITGPLAFWNIYTRQGVSEILSKLATPCSHISDSVDIALPNSYYHQDACPSSTNILNHISTLLSAFFIKFFLTVLTFHVKVPAGIYVPTMVIGALIGKALGHTIQLVLSYCSPPLLSLICPISTEDPLSCVSPGVYALIGAGAIMCGVTRLPITLFVAMLEMTGSVGHAIPFAASILTAKWAAEKIESRGIYQLVAEVNGYMGLVEGGSFIADLEASCVETVPP